MPVPKDEGAARAAGTEAAQRYSLRRWIRHNTRRSAEQAESWDAPQGRIVDVQSRLFCQPTCRIRRSQRVLSALTCSVTVIDVFTGGIGDAGRCSSACCASAWQIVED